MPRAAISVHTSTHSPEFSAPVSSDGREESLVSAAARSAGGTCSMEMQSTERAECGGVERMGCGLIDEVWVGRSAHGGCDGGGRD